MLPPEVVLDRWVKAQIDSGRRLAGCVEKLNIDQVEPPSFRSFLYFVQEAMNAALRSETVGASGGVAHPPFHFDYLQVDDNTANAYAFQHGGFAFITVTLPLVELLWRLSQLLGNSSLVVQLFHLGDGIVRPEALQGFLFQIQLSFLISHEYTHHVHRHGVVDGGVNGVWTEFLHDEGSGSIDSQAEELDADAYAAYLVLGNFIGGAGRQGALVQLGQQGLARNDADQLLLKCFLLAVTAFFCARWPEHIEMTSIRHLRHPPAPVRIEYAIRVTKMWCRQNGSIPESWFSAEQLQSLFRVAAQLIGGTAGQAWDAQITFLQSKDGAEYGRELFERFEAVRQKQHGPREH